MKQTHTLATFSLSLDISQTGMYYLRTKPAVNAIQYTVDKSPPVAGEVDANQLPILKDPDDGCLSCQS